MPGIDFSHGHGWVLPARSPADGPLSGPAGSLPGVLASSTLPAVSLPSAAASLPTPDTALTAPTLSAADIVSVGNATLPFLNSATTPTAVTVAPSDAGPGTTKSAAGPGPTTKGAPTTTADKPASTTAPKATGSPTAKPTTGAAPRRARFNLSVTALGLAAAVLLLF
ncbi:hypothetical protein SPI_08003 [Niveomyces insectorum RCEF 264]|uniref:Uncharacterized protein n=1 Tax=Niveomyces insectorum RCEF 264 TaxID=1081102 RepID=A0A167NQ59_9HYPO|nr:hypothetical protein SPI_08003 [Niveomyces insectorum RCEF 264]